MKHTHTVYGIFAMITLLVYALTLTGCKNEPDPPDTRPPAISSVSADKTTLQLPNETSITLNASAVSADNSAVKAYAWSVKTKPENASPVIASPSQSTTAVTGLTVPGTYTFELEVTGNNDVKAVSSVVTVTVNPPDTRPPAISSVSADKTTLQLPNETSITLSSTAASADNSAVKAYLWKIKTKPDGVEPEITDPANSTTTVTGLTAAGVYTFELEVTGNNDVKATSNVVSVTVNPPVIPPGPTVNTIAVTGAGTPNSNGEYSVNYTNNLSITLGGNPTVEGNTYAWEVATNPTGKTVTFSDDAVVNPTISGFEKGVAYTFKLTVTDKNNLSATKDVKLTVTDPAAPPVNNIQISGATPNGGQYKYNDTLTLSGNTAAEGNTYAWSCTPDILTFNRAAPAPTVSGFAKGVTYTLTLTVTNAHGGVAAKGVTVPIAGNAAPTASSTTTTSVSLETLKGNYTLALQGSASDTDGTIDSYKWVPISAPQGVDLENISITHISPSLGQASVSGLDANATGIKKAGNYTFRLTVTDNDDVTGTKDVTVTVNPYTAIENVVANFTGAVIDLDNGTTVLDFSPSYLTDNGWGGSFQTSAINYTLKDNKGNNDITNFGSVNSSSYANGDFVTFTYACKLGGANFEQSVVAEVVNDGGTLKFAGFFSVADTNHNNSFATLPPMNLNFSTTIGNLE